MAQSQQSQQQQPRSRGLSVKQCICGATVFYGPIPIGEIVDGVMVPREAQYTCTNCGKDQRLDQMIDRPIPQPVI